MSDTLLKQPQPMPGPYTGSNELFHDAGQSVADFAAGEELLEISRVAVPQQEQRINPVIAAETTEKARDIRRARITQMIQDDPELGRFLQDGEYDRAA